MKLKMLTSMAGVDFALAFGEVTDRFGKKEATRLIEAGLAEACDGKLSPLDASTARIAELESKLVELETVVERYRSRAEAAEKALAEFSAAASNAGPPASATETATATDAPETR